MMPRAAVLFVALALLALLSGWVADLLAPRAPVSRAERHTPDYYLAGVTARAMDENGKLHHRMRAVRIAHFSDDDSSELEQPRFYTLEDGSERWEVRSDSGSSSGDGKVVELRGAVSLNDRGDRPGQLQTRDLQLRPGEDYVETAAPVTFRDSSSRIDAVGMRGYLNQGGTLELLSEVRGTHVPRN